MKPIAIKNECPYCLYETDAASSITGDNKPVPGSVSICIDCGEAGIFDETLNLRIMTEDDIEEIAEETMSKVRLAKMMIKATRKKDGPCTQKNR